jgi:predicted TIM-barrel enzyme
MDRKSILKKLRAEVDAGKYITAAGCGTGLSAICCEDGGCDLIFGYNTAKYRMAGISSLAGLMPFGDANALTLELAREIIPQLKKVPFIGGICGTDPFRYMPGYLQELKNNGVAGIMNWPSVGLIDGMFRENLEGSGIKLEQEVAVIKLAHEMDMLTAPFGYDPETTKDMVEAGADIIVTMMGFTSGGPIGARKARPLDGAVEDVQAIADTALALNPDVLVLAHGGPIATAKDTEYVLHNTTNVHGFFGGSAMERFPNQVAQTAAVKEFKAIRPAAN